MHTIKLTIEYDGTNYHGWQIQPGFTTIQGIFQESLSKILGKATKIYGAGRTDAGVHARGQVAHFYLQKYFPLEILHRAINATIPNDLVVRKIEEVPSSFHAQYSAKGKEYRYYILNQSVRSAFYKKHALFIPFVLDCDQMKEALSHLVGTHDFFALSVAPEKMNTIRTITRADLFKEDNFWVISLEGTGFLHKMVRRIVGTMIDVGRHKIPCTMIPEILQSRNKGLGGLSAAPYGLYLISVKY